MVLKGLCNENVSSSKKYPGDTRIHSPFLQGRRSDCVRSKLLSRELCWINVTHTRDTKNIKWKDLMNALSARCSPQIWKYHLCGIFRPPTVCSSCREFLMTRLCPQSPTHCAFLSKNQNVITLTPVRTRNTDPPLPEQTVAHFFPPWGPALTHVVIAL